MKTLSRWKTSDASCKFSTDTSGSSSAFVEKELPHVASSLECFRSWYVFGNKNWLPLSMILFFLVRQEKKWNSTKFFAFFTILDENNFPVLVFLITSSILIDFHPYYQTNSWLALMRTFRFRFPVKHKLRSAISNSFWFRAVGYWQLPIAAKLIWMECLTERQTDRLRIWSQWIFSLKSKHYTWIIKICCKKYAKQAEARKMLSQLQWSIFWFAVFQYGTNMRLQTIYCHQRFST